MKLLPARATALFAIFAVLALAACDNAAPSEPDGTAPPTQSPRPEIIMRTLGEGGPYLETIAGGRPITWTFASGGFASGVTGPCSGNGGAAKEVRLAAGEQTEKFATVDYAALALPKYVSETRQLKLEAGSFDLVQLELDACGAEEGEARWLVYSIKGPEFPAPPNLSIIHRWPNVYALYDLKEGAVVAFYPSIRGYVTE